jgi:saccharopine dehydrogenase (NAD+, L-lysine-forming)
VTWGIYGATGFTGRLITTEALARGQRPVLLGRSGGALRQIALATGLRFEVVADPAALATATGALDLVVNAAGPFERTVRPLLAACIEGRTSYLDISNELETVEFVLGQHARFVRSGVIAVPAVGFGTVATEAVALRAHMALPSAVAIEVALLADNAGGGAGTSASVLAVLAAGGARVVDGGIVRSPLGRGITRVRTPVGDRSLVPIATGDLVSVRAATGVDSVAASVAFAVPAWPLTVSLPAVSAIARSGLLPSRAGKAAKSRAYRSYTWARATDAAGQTATAWLATGEGYAFTASSIVSAVELALTGMKPGAYSSGQAFGADFALRVPGTTIHSLDAHGDIISSS